MTLINCTILMMVVNNSLNKNEANISCPIFNNTYIRKMLLNGMIQINLILF